MLSSLPLSQRHGNGVEQAMFQNKIRFKRSSGIRAWLRHVAGLYMNSPTDQNDVSGTGQGWRWREEGVSGALCEDNLFAKKSQEGSV